MTDIPCSHVLTKQRQDRTNNFSSHRSLEKSQGISARIFFHISVENGFQLLAGDLVYIIFRVNIILFFHDRVYSKVRAVYLSWLWAALG